MKEFEHSEHVDQLISGYVDEELTDREQTELKRLIQHDDDIARKVELFRKQKELLRALPQSSAPQNMLESIRERLERKVLLDEYTQSEQMQTGKHYLYGKWFSTVAAIVVLAIALVWIVVSVLVPPANPRGLAVVDNKPEPALRREVTESKTLPEKQPVVAQSPGSDKNLQLSLSKSPTIAELNLNAAASVAVDKFVAKAIFVNDLLDCTSIERSAAKSRYVLTCDREDMLKLAADLSGLWDKCEEITMNINTKVPADYITLAEVSPDQVIEILAEKSVEDRIQMAKDFTLLNSLAPDVKLGKFADSSAQLDFDSLSAPKPVLTGVNETDIVERHRDVHKDPVNLTINVIPR